MGVFMDPARRCMPTAGKPINGMLQECNIIVSAMGATCKVDRGMVKAPMRALLSMLLP